MVQTMFLPDGLKYQLSLDIYVFQQFQSQIAQSYLD